MREGANYIAFVSADLVERSEAISQLDEALQAAQAGYGNLVVVAGPAGIGKTALWHTVEQLAAARGFAIRGASATELEVGFPYGIVRQIYRGAASSEARPSETIAPILGRATGLHDVADVSYQVLDGLYWLVDDMTTQTPLLLAVDDAQWARPRRPRGATGGHQRARARVLTRKYRGRPPLRTATATAKHAA